MRDNEGIVFELPVWEYPKAGQGHLVGARYRIDAVLLRTGDTVYWEHPSGAQLLPSYPVDGEQPLATLDSVPEEFRDALVELLPEGEIVRVRIWAVFTGLCTRDEIEVHDAQAVDGDIDDHTAEAVAWLFTDEIERSREDREQEFRDHLNYTGDW